MSAVAQNIPVLIRADGAATLVEWLDGNRMRLDRLLREAGAVLFRDFHVPDVAEFRRFAYALSSNAPIKYGERSSPRSEVADRVYTSTDHPPDQKIAMHSEQSYNNDFPLRICFFCARPAEQGGNTPIASNRDVKSRIAAGTLEQFRQKGILYQRNFNHGPGLRWQTAFGSSHKEDVAAYCRSRDIRCEWLHGDRLRTWQRRPALRIHPYTAEEVWFNHCFFFNVASLPVDVAGLLTQLLKPEDYPTHSFWGDGSAIPDDVIEELRRAYECSTVTFDWHAGDVLLLDNMLISHGRDSYKGARSVYTFMQDLASELSMPLRV